MAPLAHHRKEQAALGSRCTLIRPGVTPYVDAWDLQRRIAAEVRAGGDPALILLEHPPTFTLGVRGNPEHLLLTDEAFAARGADVIRSDRGGDVTFHGPGQVVGYPIVNLRALGQGPVWYVRALEQVIIDTLSRFEITAGRAAGLPGVWAGDAKIAAVGVRVSGGVTTHGFALNVSTDLSWFDQIVPCGLAGVAVTSMQRVTGETFQLHDVEDAVAAAFSRRFNFDLDPSRDVTPVARDAVPV